MSAPQDPNFDPNFQPPPPPVTDAEPVGSRPAQLRPFAIAAFVLGVIFVVGGAAKFLPGGIGTGAALIGRRAWRARFITRRFSTISPSFTTYTRWASALTTVRS